MKDLLDQFGVPGMTVTHVLGWGEQKGGEQIYRGAKLPSELLPKVRFEVVLEAEKVAGLLSAVVKAFSTGKVGDGKIFVSNVHQVVKIRTGEIVE
jgi:nitrogen regulatory protein PII